MLIKRQSQINFKYLPLAQDSYSFHYVFSYCADVLAPLNELTFDKLIN